jgi:hypothetical protein
VATVLAAADDRAKPASGTFGLQGPDVVSGAEFADLLAGPRRRKLRPVDPAAWVGAIRRRRRRDLSRAAAEILASDSLADAPDAAAEFGVKLTPLREGLEAAGLIRV